MPRKIPKARKHYQENPVILCNDIHVEKRNGETFISARRCYVRQPKVGKKIEDPISGEEVIGFDNISIQKPHPSARMPEGD